MIDNILTLAKPNVPELLISLIIFAFIYGIPIAIAVIFYLMLRRNKNENIRLRLEVGKLADELEQARKQKECEG